MRLIGKLHTEKEASAFTQALQREGIGFQLDSIRNTDWGSHDYGNIEYQIWVIEEEHFDHAFDLFERFQQNPHDPLFALQETGQRRLQLPSREAIKEVPSKIVELGRAARPEAPVGPTTFYLLLLCFAIFLVGVFSQPPNWPVPSTLPLSPLYASPIKRALLYDYPLPYELFNRFVEKYTQEKVLNPEELPADAEQTLVRIINLPVWEGFYDKILAWAKGSKVQFWGGAPHFTKIAKGEAWRLFTPALLHADIFHILFNMLWLYALGKQLEQKLGVLRYLLFILVAGVITNTAQYLMSGSNFLGFSGILCAMITFIMARQKLAAWEGYRLDRMTKLFILVFIFGMFAFQLTSFIIEVSTGVALTPGIANTAHMTGLLVGAILGRLPLFAWK
jgi:GlpG protein